MAAASSVTGPTAMDDAAITLEGITKLFGPRADTLARRM